MNDPKYPRLSMYSDPQDLENLLESLADTERASDRAAWERFASAALAVFGHEYSAGTIADEMMIERAKRFKKE